MTTKALSKTQQARWIKHLEDQGCRIRRNKTGFIVYFPDGHQDTVHKTGSDPRGSKNAIATFRRHGIHHPLDTRPLTEK